MLTSDEVAQGNAGPLELQFLRREVHPEGPLLEPAAGRDAAVNLSHAGS